MSYLPNPGTIRSSFDSYAEAEAATVLAPINRIFVGDLCYARDATGTALTTNGGTVKWSPQGIATFAHWGVTGSQLVPGNPGNLNEPATAEQAGLQAALDWCAANARDLYGDTSRVYGVTGPLRVGGSSGSRTWGLHNLNLYVKSWSGTVTPRSGDDPDAWAQDDAVLTFGPNGGNPLRAFKASNIHIDCNRLAGTGVRYLHCGQSNFDDIRVDRARTFGHDIGRPAYGATTAIDTTDCRYSWLRYREFWYSADPADGYTDWTVRTSCGLRVGGSDVSISESTIATGAICVAVARGFNVGFDHCSFWGTPSPAGPKPADYATRTTLLISRYASNYRFNNCRIEDGRAVVRGEQVPVGGGSYLPAFQGQFTGCSFSQYDNAQLVLIAHDANETATSLVFIGNRQRTSQAVSLQTDGSGTWGDFRAEWSGNTNENGDSWSVQGKSLVQGYFSLYTDGRVRTTSLTPTSATPGNNVMFCIGPTGILYTYGAGNWYSHTGTLVP
jgi:hypothetical protein